MKSPNPLPEHYHTLAEELGPITAMFREVLQYYPSPDGKPLEDISELIDEMNHALKKNFEALISATGSLMTEVLLKENVPQEAVRQAAVRIEETLSSMLISYHDFWKRPFPHGLEDGQALFTAVIRKPLEEYLTQLERFLSAINDPDRRPQQYIADMINLKAVFDVKDEVNAFHTWLKRPRRPEKRIAEKGLLALLLALAAGFAAAFLALSKPGK